MGQNKKKYSLLSAAVIICGSCVFSIPVFAQNQISDAVVQENLQETVNVQNIKANKETFNKAEAAYNSKNFQATIDYMNAYIDAKPKKYEAYKLRGKAYYSLRRYNLAMSDFQTAIDLKTSDDKFMTGTKIVGAVVLGADMQEQYQNAELGNLYGELMYAQKALNMPDYENSFKKAGEYNSHIYLPQPNKADIGKINCPQKYGKPFNPQGIDDTIYRVISDIENKNYNEAAYKMPKIHSDLPNYYLGYYLSGIIQENLEHEDDAITLFEKAIELNPYDFESMASLGLLYYNKSEKTFDIATADKSIKYFSDAIKYNPNCNTYYYYIGLANMIKKDYDSAIRNFDTALKYNVNDYGSRYYKAVALHITKDYMGTIEETTKLLYRHVSNYNSVLYLRALSYYKLNRYEDSVADIEKICTDLDDVYNTDIKVLSSKDKILKSYLYYLKAQILKNNGQGTKSDIAYAFSNPVIKALVELQEGTKLSYEDVQLQYDYIRTTFNNYDIDFAYEDSVYTLSLAQTLLNKEQDNNVAHTQTTENSMIVEGESSLAHMLASQTLFSANSVKPQQIYLTEKLITQEKENSFNENDVATSDKNILESSDIIEEPAEEVIVLDAETILFKAPEQKETETFKITYPKQENALADKTNQMLATIEELLPQQSEDVQDKLTEEENLQSQEDNKPVPIVIQAEEIKEDLPIVVISKNEDSFTKGDLEKPEEAIHDETMSIVKSEPSDIYCEQNLAEEQVAKQSTIKEKYANVDLNDFNIIHKTAPIITDEDEVIMLETEGLLQNERKAFEDSIKVAKNEENSDIKSIFNDDSEAIDLNQKQENLSDVQSDNEVGNISVIDKDTNHEEVKGLEELIVNIPEMNVIAEASDKPAAESDKNIAILDEDPQTLLQDNVLENVTEQAEEISVGLKEFIDDKSGIISKNIKEKRQRKLFWRKSSKEKAIEAPSSDVVEESIVENIQEDIPVQPSKYDELDLLDDEFIEQTERELSSLVKEIESPELIFQQNANNLLNEEIIANEKHEQDSVQVISEESSQEVAQTPVAELKEEAPIENVESAEVLPAAEEELEAETESLQANENVSVSEAKLSNSVLKTRKWWQIWKRKIKVTSDKEQELSEPNDNSSSDISETIEQVTDNIENEIEQTEGE